jgi:hypothetical protein
LALARPAKVRTLIRAVDSARRIPTGAPNFDDPIGDPQELSFSSDELSRANAGQTVPKVMVFEGDGGRYTLTFEAVTTRVSSAPIPDRWLAPSADGRLELFAVGTDGPLWHQWQTAQSNGWSNWVSRGPPPGANLVGAPALAPSADGRLEMFAVATDGALWHQWQTAQSNGWSTWVSHGPPPGANLVAPLR